MRVLLARDRDGGAVAIIVALLSLVLFGLAAFAVDFGLAYTSKRNLQKGADAAALSAATEIIRQAAVTSSCSEIRDQFFANTGGFADKVGAAADTYARANRTDATRQLLDVRCSTDGKRVEVVYEAQGTTPTLFGGIFGQSTDYVSARRAVADVSVPSRGLGLRPYGLCLTDLDRLRSPGGMQRIEYPAAAGLCGANGTTWRGNWFTTDCPLDANNGTLTENTRDGCLTEVAIIEPSAGNPNVTLADVETACSNLADKVPSPCLQSNPGNVSDAPTRAQWNRLLEMPGISVPVFSKTWKVWADSSAVTDCRSSGNNGCYPVEAIAGVKVCAYKWGNDGRASTATSDSTSPCFGVQTQLNSTLSVRPRDNNNYLWLSLTSVQLTGTSKPSGCTVGDDTCDAGARGTRLVE